jgi:energy-coupling factor transport system ATP-binding protein
MLITIRGLEHTYMEGTPFESKVLHGVDLDIQEGEIFGIIGPAQSGKSTIVQYLNGLFIPKKTGQVIVDGIDTAVKGIDMKTLRQKVGLVFQYPEQQLFRETVGKDVAFGPDCLKLSKEETEERVREAISAVGLDLEIFYHRYIFAMSGGQKRRAAIAGVLALRPKVMVFDDPTAGLDPQGRTEILATIDRLHSEQGITVIFVSNSLEDVYRVVDRVAVISEGRVAAVGTPREILSDVGLMNGVGLGMMQTVQVLHHLRTLGWPVEISALGVEEAAREIARIASERGHGKGASRRGTF